MSDWRSIHNDPPPANVAIRLRYGFTGRVLESLYYLDWADELHFKGKSDVWQYAGPTLRGLNLTWREA